MITTTDGVLLTEATDAELVENAESMMARFTWYRVPENAAWHTAMVAELNARGLVGTAAALVEHRREQEAFEAEQEA